MGKKMTNVLWAVAAIGLVSALHAGDTASVPLQEFCYGPVEDVDLSKNGKNMVTLSEQRVVRVWNMDSGKVIKTISPPQESWYTSVAISPDGFSLLVGSYDGVICIINTATWSVTKTILAGTSKGNSVEFMRDGSKFVASNGKLTIIYSAAGDLLKLCFSGSSDLSTNIILSPDGSKLALGLFDRSTYVFNAVTGNPITRITEKTDNWRVPFIEVEPGAFSPDGSLLFTTGLSQAIRSSDNGVVISKLSRVSNVRGGIFSSDGSKLITGTADGIIAVWNTSTWDTIAMFEEPVGCYGEFFRLVNNDSTLIYLDREHKIRTIRLSDGSLERTYFGHDAPVISCAFAPDAGKLITAHSLKKAWIWNVATADSLASISDSDGVINAVAWSPDGSTILTGSSDETVRLWNASSGEMVRRYWGAVDEITCVAFSPNGAIVAAGSADAKVRTWNTTTGAPLKVFKWHTSGIGAMTFSSDGSKILSASDSTAWLWNVATGDTIRKFTVNKDVVLAVAISPDETRILTGINNQGARLWNASTGDTLGTFDNSDGGVAFSPDGSLFLLSNYKKAYLYSTKSGEQLRMFTTRYGSNSWWVAYSGPTLFTKDGKKVLTPLLGTLQIWDISTLQGAGTERGFIRQCPSLHSFAVRNRRIAFVIRPDDRSEKILMKVYRPDGSIAAVMKIADDTKTGILSARLPDILGAGKYLYTVDGLKRGMITGSFYVVR